MSGMPGGAQPTAKQQQLSSNLLLAASLLQRSKSLKRKGPSSPTVTDTTHCVACPAPSSQQHCLPKRQHQAEPPQLSSHTAVDAKQWLEGLLEKKPLESSPVDEDESTSDSCQELEQYNVINLSARDDKHQGYSSSTSTSSMSSSLSSRPSRLSPRPTVNNAPRRSSQEPPEADKLNANDLQQTSGCSPSNAEEPNIGDGGLPYKLADDGNAKSIPSNSQMGQTSPHSDCVFAMQSEQRPQCKETSHDSLTHQANSQHSESTAYQDASLLHSCSIEATDLAEENPNEEVGTTEVEVSCRHSLSPLNLKRESPSPHRCTDTAKRDASHDVGQITAKDMSRKSPPLLPFKGVKKLLHEVRSEEQDDALQILRSRPVPPKLKLVISKTIMTSVSTEKKPPLVCRRAPATDVPLSKQLAMELNRPLPDLSDAEDQKLPTRYFVSSGQFGSLQNAPEELLASPCHIPTGHHRHHGQKKLRAEKVTNENVRNLKRRRSSAPPEVLPMWPDPELTLPDTNGVNRSCERNPKACMMSANWPPSGPTPPIQQLIKLSKLTNGGGSTLISTLANPINVDQQNPTADSAAEQLAPVSSSLSPPNNPSPISSAPPMWLLKLLKERDKLKSERALHQETAAHDNTAQHPMLETHCHRIEDLPKWVESALKKWHICVVFLCGAPGSGKTYWADKMKQANESAVHILSYEYHPSLYALEGNHVVFLPKPSPDADFDARLYRQLATEEVDSQYLHLLQHASSEHPAVIIFDDTNLSLDESTLNVSHALVAGVPVTQIAWFVADEGRSEEEEVQQLLIKSHRRHQRFLQQQQRQQHPGLVAGRSVDVNYIRVAVQQLRAIYCVDPAVPEKLADWRHSFVQTLQHKAPHSHPAPFLYRSTEISRAR